MSSLGADWLEEASGRCVKNFDDLSFGMQHRIMKQDHDGMLHCCYNCMVALFANPGPPLPARCGEGHISAVQHVEGHFEEGLTVSKVHTGRDMLSKVILAIVSYKTSLYNLWSLDM